MTPKAKAIELLDKFSDYVDYNEDDCLTQREVMHKNAKQCALIAVDEIINTFIPINNPEYKSDEIDYWQQVKTEIENL